MPDTVKHFVQRTATTGSLQLDSLAIGDGDPIKVRLFSDHQVEVPSKEHAEYIVAAYPGTRYVPQTEKDHQKTNESLAALLDPDEPMVPGQAARVVNDKGEIELVNAPDRAARPMGQPPKK